MSDKSVYTLKLPQNIKNDFQALLNREKELTGRTHGEVIQEIMEVYATYKVENASFEKSLMELDKLKKEIKIIENSLKNKRP